MHAENEGKLAKEGPILCVNLTWAARLKCINWKLVIRPFRKEIYHTYLNGWIRGVYYTFIPTG
jgi:hypothetical protein